MNYISILKILIFSILSTNLSAQAGFNAIPKIALKTTWKKGDSYQYELKKGKIIYMDDLEESRSENRQLVTLSVKESNAQGYIIEAEYNSAAYFLPEDLKKINGISVLIEKYGHTKVKYAINPYGEFLGILNGKDIQKMLLDLFDAVSASKAISETESTVLTNMKCQMASEVYITEGVFQELHLLHQFYGSEYTHDIRQEYETELANMLIPGGKPISAHASLKVSLKDDGYCFVEHELTPDPSTMKKLTFDYFSKMSGGTWKAENTDALGLVVNDNGQFAYHLRSGWLIEMLKKRTTTLDNEKTVEYVSMKMLEKGSF
jgi:hypothetical protein